MVYEITYYDLTYIGCIDKLTLFDYGTKFCLKLKYLHTGLCAVRTQPSAQNNSLFYFYMWVQDQSVSPY